MALKNIGNKTLNIFSQVSNEPVLGNSLEMNLPACAEQEDVQSTYIQNILDAFFIPGRHCFTNFSSSNSAISSIPRPFPPWGTSLKTFETGNVQHNSFFKSPVGMQESSTETDRKSKIHREGAGRERPCSIDSLLDLMTNYRNGLVLIAQKTHSLIPYEASYPVRAFPQKRNLEDFMVQLSGYDFLAITAPHTFTASKQFKLFDEMLAQTDVIQRLPVILFLFNTEL